MGELLADSDLEAVVVGNAIICRGLQTSRSVADERHAERRIGGGGSSESVNGMSGARQAGSVDVVIVVQQVDAARTDITGFQDPTGSKFILKIQVVLANQRRVRHFVDEWDAQIRAR